MPPPRADGPAVATPSAASRPAARSLAGVGLLTAALVWTYWPLLVDMVGRWSNDPQYSHGFLVPIFSAYLLWSRRAMLAGAAPDAGRWLGVGLLALAVVMRAAGAVLFFGYLDGVSLLVACAGLAAVCGGRPASNW